jgi:hypothetical protein
MMTRAPHKVETIHVQIRQPRDEADPGECAIIHYTVVNNVVKVTDKDGHMLRYPDGEPCRQVLLPGENPKQIAARLGRSHRREYDGRAFWGDISRLNGKASPV